ncbi:unnamed protein product [Polarella glacialis]|uniref:Uncharacterized protein n=1 Tax=Polarella glacialis TaxID=89957 RepID=A0A813LJT7_POLGL|nr:unnamed protein product [Polarella glacialis]
MFGFSLCQSLKPAPCLQMISSRGMEVTTPRAEDANVKLERESDTDPAMTSDKWRWIFMVMTLTFSLNHATVTTPIIYSSSVLVFSIGNYANAILYVVTMLTSLTLAPLVASTLGSKKCLLAGLCGYTIYVLCFALAAFNCRVPGEAGGCLEAGAVQWGLALGGSAIGGLGAGVLWTGQGAFFTAIVEKIVEAKQKSPDNRGREHEAILGEVTAELSSTFAFYYLGLECIVKVAFTLLQRYAMVSVPVIFCIWAGLAALATAIFAFSEDVRSSSAAGRASACGKTLAAITLWADPTIWLLAFTNLTFGFSVAWLNGYVNAHFLKDAVSSTSFIGFLGALITFIAGVSSKLFGWIGGRSGKGPILLLGSVCFLLVGLLSLITAPAGRGPGGWGWGILAFYVLQGLGRGVYESTNKGIFGDFFPGPQGVGAFANVMVQGTLSSSIGFILVATKTEQAMIYLLLVSATMTFPCYLVARMIQQRKQGEHQDSESTASEEGSSSEA